MQERKYFIPNETYDKAIQNKEKGVLKALLIGIIGSDPTFATQEYDEAVAYVKSKSEELTGEELNLSEPYQMQEDEYVKEQSEWTEEYYRMLLVWYRDNYAKERLQTIKTVGKEVYKNKLTFGKYKLQNRTAPTTSPHPSNANSTQPEKKAPVVRAAGNDKGDERLSFTEWLKRNWKAVVAIAGGVVVAIGVIYAISCLFRK